MKTTVSLEQSGVARGQRTPPRGSIKALVGSGDKIALFASPFVITGLALNLWQPSLFGLGGPSLALKVLSVAMLIPGVTLWFWSAALIVSRVPRGELITHGPYALLKHPLYTGVALLVLPGLGLWLDSWLGIVLGAVLYFASRLYAPDEERELSATFGSAWDDYCKRVIIPWL